MAGLSMGAFKKNLGNQSEDTGAEDQVQDSSEGSQEDLNNEGNSDQVEAGQDEVSENQQSQEEDATASEPAETGEEELENPDLNSEGDDNKSPEDQPSSGSSLKDETPNEGNQNQAEVNDDLVAKYLSEKLGKEVNLDELTTQSTNPLDEDPYMKEVFEWRKKTGRPIEDFVKFQQDFSKVSDLDVAREFLQLEYPDSTPSEINLELKKFRESEDDLEEEVEQKKWELKKYATKGRQELNKLKANLGEPSQSSLPSDIQEKVQLADQVKSQMQANQKAQEEYFEGIKNTARSVDKLTLNLGEDNNIDYVVSEQDRKSIPDLINEMPHWRNSDGSWNHRAVVEDGIKIQNFDKMVALAYEQGKNSGKDDLIRETKNVNLKDTGSSAQPSNKTNKPIYEDQGEQKELKVRFKKRKK